MQRFERQLRAAAERIDLHIARAVERDLVRSGRVPAKLAAAMQHAVVAGGKRFRPFLVVTTSQLFGGVGEAVLDTATAVEVLHCYSLVHDDLPAMDDDELRRGRPTVHVAFGEATAILAGDALQTYAFELIAKAPRTIVGELVTGLALASGGAGMAGGQQLDMEAEAAVDPPTIAALERLHAMKTGALIAFAVDAGAIHAGAAPATRDALRQYAQALGLAFQIRDDLLDVDATAEQLGKTPGKDRAAGKATFVTLLGESGARQRLAEVEGAAIAALSKIDVAAATGSLDVLADAARYAARRSR